ncbi:UNVERIFIED_CONTAM: hypothetical protein FKN15_013237 [Acipenser sinensis]
MGLGTLWILSFITGAAHCLSAPAQGVESVVRSRVGGSAVLGCNLTPPSAPPPFPLHVIEWVRLGWAVPVFIKFGLYSPRVHPNYQGPPIIVLQPADLSLNVSQDAALHCHAEAYPSNLTYLWWKGGENVFHIQSLKSRVRILVDGTLLIQRVIPEDAGNYSCVPTNGILTPPTASAYIRVLHPAQAVDMPAETYLPMGMQGVITCPAPGWVVNSTGSVSIATANEDALGLYTCTPYNSYGTVGQSAATRVVLQDPPTFRLSPRAEYLQEVGLILIWSCVECFSDLTVILVWSCVECFTDLTVILVWSCVECFSDLTVILVWSCVECFSDLTVILVWSCVECFSDLTVILVWSCVECFSDLTVILVWSCVECFSDLTVILVWSCVECFSDLTVILVWSCVECFSDLTVILVWSCVECFSDLTVILVWSCVECFSDLTVILVWSCIEALTPLIEALTPLIEALTPLIEALTPLIEALTPLIEALTPLIEALTPLIEALTPLIEALTPLIEALTPLIEALTPLIEALTPLIEALTPLIEALTPLIEALTPLIEALTPLIEALTPLIEALTPLIEALTPLIEALTPLIEALTPLIEALTPLIEALTPLIEALTPLIEALTPLIEALTPLIEALTPLIEALTPLIEALTPLIEALTPLIEALTPLIEALTPLIEALTPLIEALTPLIEALTPLIEALTPPIEALTPLIEALTPPIEALTPHIETLSLVCLPVGTSPHAVSELAVTPGVNTANLTWEPGFDGGYTQRFSVWLKRVSQGKHEWTSLPVPLSQYSLLVSSLFPDTAYQFSVLPQNKLGSGPFSEIVTDYNYELRLLSLGDNVISAPSESVNISTAGMDTYPSQTRLSELLPGPILAGVVGGVSFLCVAIILSVLTACVMNQRRGRRRRKRREGKESTELQTPESSAVHRYDGGSWETVFNVVKSRVQCLFKDPVLSVEALGLQLPGSSSICCRGGVSWEMEFNRMKFIQTVATGRERD